MKKRLVVGIMILIVLASYIPISYAASVGQREGYLEIYYDLDSEDFYFVAIKAKTANSATIASGTIMCYEGTNLISRRNAKEAGSIGLSRRNTERQISCRYSGDYNIPDISFYVKAKNSFSAAELNCDSHIGRDGEIYRCESSCPNGWTKSDATSLTCLSGQCCYYSPSTTVVSCDSIYGFTCDENVGQDCNCPSQCNTVGKISSGGSCGGLKVATAEIRDCSGSGNNYYSNDGKICKCPIGFTKQTTTSDCGRTYCDSLNSGYACRGSEECDINYDVFTDYCPGADSCCKEKTVDVSVQGVVLNSDKVDSSDGEKVEVTISVKDNYGVKVEKGEISCDGCGSSVKLSSSNQNAVFEFSKLSNQRTITFSYYDNTNEYSSATTSVTIDVATDDSTEEQIEYEYTIEFTPEVLTCNGYDAGKVKIFVLRNQNAFSGAVVSPSLSDSGALSQRTTGEIGVEAGPFKCKENKRILTASSHDVSASIVIPPYEKTYFVEISPTTFSCVEKGDKYVVKETPTVKLSEIVSGKEYPLSETVGFKIDGTDVSGDIECTDDSRTLSVTYEDASDSVAIPSKPPPKVYRVEINPSHLECTKEGNVYKTQDVKVTVYSDNNVIDAQVTPIIDGNSISKRNTESGDAGRIGLICRDNERTLTVNYKDKSTSITIPARPPKEYEIKITPTDLTCEKVYQIYQTTEKVNSKVYEDGLLVTDVPLVVEIDGTAISSSSKIKCIETTRKLVAYLKDKPEVRSEITIPSNSAAKAKELSEEMTDYSKNRGIACTDKGDSYLFECRPQGSCVFSSAEASSDQIWIESTHNYERDNDDFYYCENSLIDEKSKSDCCYKKPPTNVPYCNDCGGVASDFCRCDPICAGSAGKIIKQGETCSGTKCALRGKTCFAREDCPPVSGTDYFSGECPGSTFCCKETPVDSDSDLVYDHRDECQGTDSDHSNNVDGSGCALNQLDTDSDGIMDEDDECIAEKEVVNGLDDDDGCPDNVNPTLRLAKKVIDVKIRDESKIVYLGGELNPIASDKESSEDDIEVGYIIGNLPSGSEIKGEQLVLKKPNVGGSFYVNVYAEDPEGGKTIEKVMINIEVAENNPPTGAITGELFSIHGNFKEESEILWKTFRFYSEVDDRDPEDKDLLTTEWDVSGDLKNYVRMHEYKDRFDLTITKYPVNKDIEGNIVLSVSDGITTTTVTRKLTFKGVEVSKPPKAEICLNGMCGVDRTHVITNLDSEGFISVKYGDDIEHRVINEISNSVPALSSGPGVLYTYSKAASVFDNSDDVLISHSYSIEIFGETVKSDESTMRIKLDPRIKEGGMEAIYSSLIPEPWIELTNTNLEVGESYIINLHVDLEPSDGKIISSDFKISPDVDYGDNSGSRIWYYITPNEPGTYTINYEYEYKFHGDDKVRQAKANPLTFTVKPKAAPEEETVVAEGEDEAEETESEEDAFDGELFDEYRQTREGIDSTEEELRRLKSRLYVSCEIVRCSYAEIEELSDKIIDLEFELDDLKTKKAEIEEENPGEQMEIAYHGYKQGERTAQGKPIMKIEDVFVAGVPVSGLPPCAFGYGFCIDQQLCEKDGSTKVYPNSQCSVDVCCILKDQSEEDIRIAELKNKRWSCPPKPTSKYFEYRDPPIEWYDIDVGRKFVKYSKTLRQSYKEEGKGLIDQIKTMRQKIDKIPDELLVDKQEVKQIFDSVKQSLSEVEKSINGKISIEGGEEEFGCT